MATHITHFFKCGSVVKTFFTKDELKIKEHHSFSFFISTTFRFRDMRKKAFISVILLILQFEWAVVLSQNVYFAISSRAHCIVLIERMSFLESN